MEASIFKFAFFLLIGLAILALLAMGTTVIVLGVKVVWSWLRAHVRPGMARHA
jgi:hypothetical protein